MDREKERQLEHQFSTTLSYIEAKDLVSIHGYTAGKIRGAITRYCKAMNIDRPQTFQEMKIFSPDFVDWWIDTNPDTHEGLAETKTVGAVESYLAFTTVWKAKIKNNDVISDAYKIKASTLLLMKNSLAASKKAGLSYVKRLPGASGKTISEAFVKAHQTVLNLTFAMQAGDYKPVQDKEIDELGSLIGGYFAKDKGVLAAVSTLKQIEASNA